MQFCLSDIPHIAPSNEAEVRTFLWMDSKDAEENRHFCQQHGQVSAHTNTHTHTHTHVHIHVHHSPYIYVIYTKVKRMEGWYMVYLQSVHIAELMSEVYSKLEFNHCWKVDKLHGFL